LREALSCFLAQDYDDAELVILNEHPSPIQCDIPRVTVLNEPDTRDDLSDGLKFARRRLVEYGDSPMMTWWDDDDLYMPWRMSQAMEHYKFPAWSPTRHWYTLGQHGNMSKFTDIILAANNVEPAILIDRKELLSRPIDYDAPNQGSGWFPGWVYQELHHSDVIPAFVLRWGIPVWQIPGAGSDVNPHERLSATRRFHNEIATEPLYPSNIIKYFREMARKYGDTGNAPFSDELSSRLADMEHGVLRRLVEGFGSYDTEYFGGTYTGGCRVWQCPEELTGVIQTIWGHGISGGNYLEVGVANGGLARVMSEFFDIELYLIDKKYSGNLPVNVQAGRLLEADSHSDAAKAGLEDWGVLFDIAVIDAGTEYHEVRPDCDTALPYVRRGGVVIFHDANQPGVKRTIGELCDSGALGHVATFDVRIGTAVLEKL